MEEDLTGKIQINKLSDGKLAVRLVCQYCGSPCDGDYIRFDNKAEAEEYVRKFSYSDYKSSAWHVKCSAKACWNIIFAMYKQAFNNDSQMLIILNSIERVTDTTIRPMASVFEEMLANRGVTITSAYRNIWNIAIDECRAAKLGTSIPSKWVENKKLNKALDFLGFK